MCVCAPPPPISQSTCVNTWCLILHWFWNLVNLTVIRLLPFSCHCHQPDNLPILPIKGEAYNYWSHWRCRRYVWYSVLNLSVGIFFLCQEKPWTHETWAFSARRSGRASFYQGDLYILELFFMSYKKETELRPFAEASVSKLLVLYIVQKQCHSNWTHKR